jgi:RimJ/RimL family protein N-acetyltransferase
VWVLAFRDDEQRLVAVSAFDPRRIDIPLNAPVEHHGWHLQVVALDREQQGHGLAQVVFAETFAAMREVDPARILVTGNIHKDNSPSFAAAGRAGLTRLVPLDEHYWVVLGEVPKAR